MRNEKHHWHLGKQAGTYINSLPGDLDHNHLIVSNRGISASALKIHCTTSHITPFTLIYYTQRILL